MVAGLLDVSHGSQRARQRPSRDDSNSSSVSRNTQCGSSSNNNSILTLNSPNASPSHRQGLHPTPLQHVHPSKLLTTRRKRQISSLVFSRSPSSLSFVVMLVVTAAVCLLVATAVVQRNRFARQSTATTHLDSSRVDVTTTALAPTSSFSISNHTHAIPNILIFTHRNNFLDDNFLAKTDTAERDELLVLQHNVRHSISLHPRATVRFLTDDDCIRSIRAVYNNATIANRLVSYFQNERQGMFKADLCRGAALWETGGLYLDVDLGVRPNLWSVLQTNTSFCTVRVHGQSPNPNAFFQAFMGATPRHVVIRRYVDLFLEYYDGSLEDGDDVVGRPLGVVFLRRAFDEIVQEEEEPQQQGEDREDGVRVENQNDQEQAEEELGSNSESGNDGKTESFTNNEQPVVVAYSPMAATTEIWQEILYSTKLQKTLFKDIPPPTWGTRRACKFVVLSSLKLPVTVPFYSRIAGSRMCPAAAVGLDSLSRKKTDQAKQQQ